MDKYGLIGFPLGHSFSIVYFNEKFQSEGIDAVYENFEIETIEQLKIVLDTNPELRGLNVTIPYKQEVMKFLHEISPEAQVVGAVNVIRIERKGSKSVLKGFNSDVIGFQQSIEPILESHHKKALILGMGGAAKAVDYVLKKMGLETLYVSRNKAEGAILYDEVDEKIIKDYPVIVNCTPVGMYPNIEECPRLPYHAMDSHTLLYDLLYNPDETMFMKKGKQYGAMVKNGLEMLLLQAIGAWSIWNK